MARGLSPSRRPCRAMPEYAVPTPRARTPARRGVGYPRAHPRRVGRRVRRARLRRRDDARHRDASRRRLGARAPLLRHQGRPVRRGRWALRCARMSTSRVCSPDRATSSASTSCDTCSRRGSGPMSASAASCCCAPRSAIASPRRCSPDFSSRELHRAHRGAAGGSGCRAAREPRRVADRRHPDRPACAEAAGGGRGIRRRTRRADRPERAALPHRLRLLTVQPGERIIHPVMNTSLSTPDRARHD